MFELMSLKSELALICGTLTKALLAEILTAVEKVSKNPDTKDKISSLINSLCDEAVDRIFKILDHAAAGPGSKDPPDSGRTHKGGNTAGKSNSSTEKTLILVYNQSVAVDSRRIPHVLQNPAAHVTGENNSTGKARTPAGCSDHDYARCRSQPVGTSPSEVGRVSASPQTYLPCFQCRKLFPNAERLADHHMKTHPVCTVCGVGFASVQKLREHEVKAHGPLPYSCDHCANRFNQKAHRDLHVKVWHSNETSFHCDTCGKDYASAGMLKTHQMTHSDKTFICDVCGKSFDHLPHLTRHKLVHQDVRQCDTKAGSRRSHRVLHSRGRQLCPFCGKIYGRLKNHIIRKHTQGLLTHELPATSSIITCQDCGKRFPNQSELRVHQRRHKDVKSEDQRAYHLKNLLSDHHYTQQEAGPPHREPPAPCSGTNAAAPLPSSGSTGMSKAHLKQAQQKLC